ncbi:MAG: hypothetical protein U0359_13740 [Byssovorax sp.]
MRDRHPVAAVGIISLEHPDRCSNPMARRLVAYLIEAIEEHQRFPHAQLGLEEGPMHILDLVALPSLDLQVIDEGEARAYLLPADEITKRDMNRNKIGRSCKPIERSTAGKDKGEVRQERRLTHPRIAENDRRPTLPERARQIDRAAILLLGAKPEWDEQIGKP